MDKPIQASYAEKLIVALLAVRFKERVYNGQKRLNEALFIFKPETVLKWHRGLVKRKWTFEHKVKQGRPCIEAALQRLIIQLAKDNPSLGYEKLQGELLKLGYELSISTVRNILKRHHIVPASRTESPRKQLAYLPEPLPSTNACLRFLHR